MSKKKSVPANPERQMSMLSALVDQLRLVWYLLTDHRVSILTKLIVPFSFLYLISPIDFIPDVILGLGQLDDLGVIMVGLALFVKLCPPELVQFYRNQLRQGLKPPDDDDTIDTTYRVIEDKE